MAEHMRIGGVEITAVSTMDDGGSEMITLLVMPVGAGMTVAARSAVSTETGEGTARFEVRRHPTSQV